MCLSADVSVIPFCKQSKDSFKWKRSRIVVVDANIYESTKQQFPLWKVGHTTLILRRNTDHLLHFCLALPSPINFNTQFPHCIFLQTSALWYFCKPSNSFRAFLLLLLNHQTVEVHLMNSSLASMVKMTMIHSKIEDRLISIFMPLSNVKGRFPVRMILPLLAVFFATGTDIDDPPNNRSSSHELIIDTDGKDGNDPGHYPAPRAK